MTKVFGVYLFIDNSYLIAVLIFVRVADWLTDGLVDLLVLAGGLGLARGALSRWSRVSVVTGGV